MQVIEVEPRDLNMLGNLAIFSVRYSLPRNTSADMACTMALASWWKFIPDNDKRMILETIESEKDLYGYDPFLWNEFLQNVKDGKYD